MSHHRFLVLAVVLALVSVPAEAQSDEDGALVPVSIGPVPQIDEANWTLLIDGLVEREVRLSYEEFVALGNATEEAELRCVTGPSASAVWTGVPLSTLLDLAGVREGAVKVAFHSADGFSTDLTVEEALADGVLLSYGMNGAPLPPGQGFPAQLVVPGHWGYKWAKWVVHIEVLDHDYKGYWENRGWADDARITGPTDWRYHAVLLVAAAVVGAFPLIDGGRVALGLKPRAARWHRWAGTAFAVLLLVVFAWWAATTLDFRGGLFFSWHGRIALLAAIMAAGTLMTGIALMRGKGRARRWHSALSTAAILITVAALFSGLILALPIFA